MEGKELWYEVEDPCRKELSEMRPIGKLVLPLAVVTFGGMIVTPALATTPVWHVCTNLEAEVGNFEDSSCTKEKTGGKYEWLEVTGTEKVVEKGTVALKITVSTIKVEVKCSTTGEGVIGPENKGKITKETFEKCTSAEHAFCPEPVEVQAVYSPWKTELLATEKTIRNKITSGGSGAPGWEVICGSGTEKIADRCTSETSAPLIEDVSGGVDSVFESKSGKYSCSPFGNAESGEVSGTTKIEDNGGKGVEAGLQRLIAKNTGGGVGGGEHECLFTVVGQKCTITVENDNAVGGERLRLESLDVREEGRLKPSEEYFQKIKSTGAECQVGTVLEPQFLCHVTIELIKEIAARKGSFVPTAKSVPPEGVGRWVGANVGLKR
jgi:hypothetical protein